MVTKNKDLSRGNPGFPLLALLAKKCLQKEESIVMYK